MKEPYCFSRHLNAHPSSSEQLESVPERKGFARCVTSMNLSLVSHWLLISLEYIGNVHFH